MCSRPSKGAGKLQSGCLSWPRLQRVCRPLTVLLPTHTSCPHSTASDLTLSPTHHGIPGRDGALAQARHKTGHGQVHLGQVCTQHIKRSAAKPSWLEDVPRHNAGTWPGPAPRPQAHRGTRWAGTVGSITPSPTVAPRALTHPYALTVAAQSPAVALPSSQACTAALPKQLNGALVGKASTKSIAFLR